MTVIKCDICRKEIPVVKKNILGKEIDVISAGTVKCEICDVHHIFDRLDLCEECARDLSVKLDTEFLRIRLSASKEEEQSDTPAPDVAKKKENKQGYIVPAELPRSCNECHFGTCKFSYPFWSEKKPNTQGYVCRLDKEHRVLEMGFDETAKAEWCPLREVKKERKEKT